VPPLTSGQVARLFGTGAGLREQAFWRVIYDSAAHVDDVLGLNAGLDLAGRRAPIARPGQAHGRIGWHDNTGQLLRWLLAGRTYGPVFLTDRRAQVTTRRRARRARARDRPGTRW
jgi:hypothetical protein